jgi:uncharacterized short protein YbdD (DUF466 family)
MRSTRRGQRPESRGQSPEARVQRPEARVETRSEERALDPSGLWTPDSGLLARLLRTVRTIIGVPDYERYLEHARRCHPDRAPLTRDEFARDRLEARYSQPGNRCC